MRFLVILLLLTSAAMLSCKSSDDEPAPQTTEVQPVVTETETNNTQDEPQNTDPVMAQKFFITISGFLKAGEGDVEVSICVGELPTFMK